MNAIHSSFISGSNIRIERSGGEWHKAVSPDVGKGTGFGCAPARGDR